MHTANLGDRVRIQYCSMPKPGALPHKASVQKTCEFTVGSSEVFRSLSLGVVGMAQGDRKQLTLQPREAYGKVQPKLIRRIPRERFPQHVALRVGKRLAAVESATGRRRRFRVVKINPDSVLVDGNHPLAGKVVELEVCLVSIDSALAAKRLKPQQGRGGKK
jgi:peptidylprolyl isomerase